MAARTFDVAMRELILVPAGMSGSSMASAADENRAVGYKRSGDNLVAAKPTALATTLGAGALVTNLPDWGAWQWALASNRLITSASHAKALQPTIMADGSKSNYGFGVIVDTLRGVDREMHTGVMQGFSARWEYFPESGYSFLIVANLHDARLGDLATAISHQLVPGVSYSTLAPMEQADQKQLALFKAGLREAALEEGKYDLLGPGMRDFATKAEFAPLRASMKNKVATLGKLELLRAEPKSASGVSRFLLRGHSREGLTYWTISMKEGLITGLNWEDD